MSAITEGATLTYDNGLIRFEDASDLLLPFSGSIVIPWTPADPALDLDTLTPEQFIHLSLWMPAAAPSGGPLFESLRTLTGERVSATGSVILLVAQDHTSFSDFDFSGLVSDGDFFTPQFGEGTVGSSRPKVILVTLDGSPALPDLAPEARNEGFSLKTLVTTLPSTISGTLRAFDISGREIDADAAVVLLDPEATIASAPEATKVRVQLVDVWGGVLDPGALPVSAIEFDPALSDFDATRGVSTLTFPDNERRLKVSTVKSDSELETDVAEGERYRHRHAYVAVWPGYEFDFHEISGSETELNLNEAVAEGTTTPNFLRLCIWHPTQTMQTTIGGGINQAGEFALATPAQPANKLRLYGRADTASVLNDGLAFFRDFYAEVEAAKAGDELYLTNWKASAHLHLRGSLTAYGIESAEIERASIDDALAVIDQQRILVALDGGDKRFVLLADSGGRGDSLRDSFHTEVGTLPDVTTKAKKISAGFLRPGGPYALILGGENGAPDPQQVTASWKNPFGEVDTTSKTLSALPTVTSPGDFPDAVALGIDAQDPPQATVIRTTTFSEIQNVAPSATNLLVINVSAGTSTYLDLNVDPTAEDVPVGTLTPSTTADDVVIAAVLSSVPDADTPFTDVLLSGFRTLSYDAIQHASGLIPLNGEELGGLLRRAIARGVIVRALFWQQNLANLDTGTSLSSGHTNNVELAALINREVDGKRGFAVLDRATRPFGSFHQKTAAIITKPDEDVVAWVGGIDLALGRWDTEEHFSRDPDRQGKPWWDVQVKLRGHSAVDVVRNFKHRWDAIGRFIFDEVSNCVPSNRSLAIATATQTPFEMPDPLHPITLPDAFVQITRTFPSAACYQQLPDQLRFVGDKGELGTLAIYLKVIAAARKFIVINDQYFFSTELALALHEALTKPDGPDFLVLLLPKDLDEQETIDPLLFKTRQKALHVLFYGGTYNAPDASPTLHTPRCGHITANPVDNNSPVLKKTAVLHARNRDARLVYVHSKHMIVDDVWMSIGSTNVNFRSMTYDCEINANIVGRSLFKGGAGVVRRQRIEIASRMTGLPAAYAPLIQDPTAMFRLFKALEAKDDNPSHVLHPLAPMVQKLDPAYVKKTTANDAAVDIVIALPMNDPIVDFVSCNVLDADGRRSSEPLAPLPALTPLGHNPVNAYLRLDITIGCQDLIRNAITGGIDSFVEIRTTQTFIDSDGNPTMSGPNRTHLIELQLVGNSVTLSQAQEEIVIPVATDSPVTIDIRVVDDTDTPLGCSGSLTTDPTAETISAGEFLNRGITISP